jgi:hypothetical protein
MLKPSEMQRLADQHDADRSRLVCADLLRASADISDESSHLDNLESARARLYTAEKLCKVLHELRSEIGELSPQGRAWELCSSKLRMWRRVEAYWDGVVRDAGEIVSCSECGAPSEEGDLHAAPGINRGSYCDVCVEMVGEELGEGVG